MALVHDPGKRALFCWLTGDWTPVVLEVCDLCISIDEKCGRHIPGLEDVQDLFCVGAAKSTTVIVPAVWSVVKGERNSLREHSLILIAMSAMQNALASPDVMTSVAAQQQETTLLPQMSCIFASTRGKASVQGSTVWPQLLRAVPTRACILKVLPATSARAL